MKSILNGPKNMNKLCIKRTKLQKSETRIDGGSGINFRLCKRKHNKIKFANILLPKSYENIKIANNRLKGRWSWPSKVNWWSHDAMLRKKWKNMMLFGAHTFVNCANNLYASKILSFNIATTQYLSIFTNTRKIIIKKHICKAHTDHSKAKSAISKIFRSTHFTQNRMSTKQAKGSS